MKRLLMIVLVLGVILTAVQAVETALPEEDGFISELTFQLRQRGWDNEELRLLREQSRLLRWEEVRKADPATVAFALHYGTYNTVDHSPQMARVRAQLALQLALETRELERLGYGFQAIAQGAARGIRDVTALDETPLTGNMVRNAIRNGVALQQKSVIQNSFRGGQGFGAKQMMGGPNHRPGRQSGAGR